MKTAFATIAAGVILAAGAIQPQTALAQSYEAAVFCEPGHYNSYKLCEAATDYPGTKTYQWYGDANVLLSSNCTKGGRFCSAYCVRGARSGVIYVSVLNASGQLVATASDSIGCAS